MSDHSTFRRVVLGMRYSAPRHGLRQAADLAALLQVELHGVFLREGELTGLAAIPLVREFRPLEGGWHAVELDGLLQALDAAARSAERCFSEAVKGRNLTCDFEIVQGTIAQAVASISRSGDILVVPAPTSHTERVTLQFQSLIESALGSDAAVLIVPERVARDVGPVVALAAGPQDASIAAASIIATFAHEPLSVIDLPKAIEASHKPGENLSYHVIEGLLRPLQERLVVITRGTLSDSIAAEIVSARRVPVLIVEPHSQQG